MINNNSKFWMVLIFVSIASSSLILPSQADSFAQFEFDADRSAVESAEPMAAPNNFSQAFLPESRAEKFKKRTRRNLLQKLYAGNPARVGIHVGLLSWGCKLALTQNPIALGVGAICGIVNVGCFVYDIVLSVKDAGDRSSNPGKGVLGRIYGGKPARLSSHSGILATMFGAGVLGVIVNANPEMLRSSAEVAAAGAHTAPLVLPTVGAVLMVPMLAFVSISIFNYFKDAYFSVKTVIEHLDEPEEKALVDA